MLTQSLWYMPMAGIVNMKNKLPKLYISGPMTGIVDKNAIAFRLAAICLGSKGYKTVNPWDLDVKDSRETWEECLRRDIKEMMECDGIATLPGCQKSRGAQLEIGIAKALKWPVHTVEYWEKYALHNKRSS